MDKVCYIFAGVNGAGKTTLYNINKDKDLGTRINIDEILHDSKGDWRSESDQKKALIEAYRLIEECIKNGKKFNYETVLTGDAYSFINRIKENGYKVRIDYIGLDNYNMAIERVKCREKKGGHGIPEEDIIRRYNESLKNLLKIIPLCDAIYVYDNSVKMIKVASGINGKIENIIKQCDWFNKLFN